MAILLGTSGSGTQPSRVRKWGGKIGAAAALTVACSDASPAVVTLTAHGLQSGDVCLGYGFTNNTNLNGGPFLVVYTGANTFTLTTFAGAAINGGGVSSDSGASIVRLFCNHKPHDVLNMIRTLAGLSQGAYPRDLDSADPTYPREQTMLQIWGPTQGKY
jgi:hypothetical protein